MPKRKCVFSRQTKNAKKQAKFRNKCVEMNNQNTYCSSVISEHSITLSDSFHSVKTNQQSETPISTYSIILSDSSNTTPISEYDITLSGSPKTPTNTSQHDTNDIILSDIPKNLTNIDNKVVLNKKNERIKCKRLKSRS